MLKSSDIVITFPSIDLEGVVITSLEPVSVGAADCRGQKSDPRRIVGHTSKVEYFLGSPKDSVVILASTRCAYMKTKTRN